MVEIPGIVLPKHLPQTAPAEARGARFGLIGDVHGESAQLQRALEALRGEHCDLILCVGDVVDGSGDVDECCRLLQAPDIRCVRGNHDRWYLEGTHRDLPNATPFESLSKNSQAFLQGLPAEIYLDTPLGRILLCHGLGIHDMAHIMPADTRQELAAYEPFQRLREQSSAKLVVNGHTHTRMVRTIEGMVLINAGTLRPSDDPCYGIADFHQRNVTYYSLTQSPPYRECDWYPIVGL